MAKKTFGQFRLADALGDTPPGPTHRDAAAPGPRGKSSGKAELHRATARVKPGKKSTADRQADLGRGEPTAGSQGSA